MTASDEELNRVRQLLQSARYATMATVNPDGSPHNSPYFFLYSPDLSKVYWGTHPGSQHSRNILRTGQLFIVTYAVIDEMATGLYIRAEQGHIAEDAELDEALGVHNSFRARQGKTVLDKDYYRGDNPQRMWLADVTALWTNGVERGADGHTVRDFRQPITAAELFGQL